MALAFAVAVSILTVPVQESYADDYTAAQKEAVAKLKLWELYDAAKNAEGKTKTGATKKYEKAAARLDSQIEKILKAKK